jgi:uncharacterized protein HemY
MIESSLSVEQALLYIDEGDYESALRAINRAIDQTEQHASQSGRSLTSATAVRSREHLC